MRKGIFVVLSLAIAVNLYLMFGVNTAQAQRCGLPGMLPCKSSTPTPQRTPRPTPNTPQPTPRPSPSQPPRPTMASLSIYSTPGSRITLNGKPSGQTAGDGWFYMSSLMPARYVVKVSLTGHREVSQTIILKAGSSESLQMPLVAFPGTLNVTTNIQGATIEIEGIGTYPNKVSSLSLGAGNYQITVSKTGYKRAAQNEYIAPGQTKNIQILLSPINIQELLDEAHKSYAANEAQKTIALCNDILTLEPKNARANLLAGLSLYVLKEYDRSYDHFVRAISAGETLRLPFGRRRVGIWEEVLEPRNIELTQTTIAFGQEFKVPYNKITVLKTENKGFDGSWRLFMKVSLPNKKGKENDNDFHFYSSAAVVVAIPTTDGKTQYSKIICKDCEPGIQFIYKLITNFRESSGGVNTK